jgi:hypothetical protein
MGILTRLLSSRWIGVGALFVIFGGLMRTVEPISRLLPPPWGDIFSYISTIVGLSTMLVSFERYIESFRKTIHDYMVPHHFAQLPIAQTPFAHAIRELIDHHVRQHEGGYLPIYRDMEIEVTIDKVLSEDDVNKNYNVPKPPPGYSWIWFCFTIRSTWIFKPEVWERERILDPQDLLGEVIVMSYKTYVDTYKWNTPRRLIYFPVSITLFAEEDLKSLWQSVEYLRPKYKISRWKNRQLYAGPIELQMKALLPGDSREKEIRRIFPGIERHPFLLSSALEGVYQVYIASKETTYPELRISYPAEKDDYWKFEEEHIFLLPAKVWREQKILWDQLSFPIPFGRVATVKQITFQKSSSIPVTFRKDYSPSLLCYPYFKDPGAVKVELTNQGASWTVDLGGGFCFPGDTIIFYWYDALIKDALRIS